MSTAKTLVSIPVKCSRTGKTHNTPMPLDEVQGYLSRQDEKTNTGTALTNVVSGAGAAPDLVILWKGKLHILNTVHESSDAAIGRYVNSILKEDAYEVPAPRTRGASAADDTAAAPSDGDAPKKRGRKPKSEAAATPADSDDFNLVVDEA